MATIHDVAREAGVAASTVSRHINGHRVRRAAAIDAAIASLGFTLSASARNLRRGTTDAIAMVVPDIENPFYAATVAGAEAVARANGLRLFLCNTDENVEIERAVLADVIQQVDGVILVPATDASSTSLFEGPRGLPLVLMDREVAGPARFDTVVIDNHRGGEAAARHLLALGHRDVALLSGPLSATQGAAREAGFLDAMARGGAAVASRRIERGNFREDGGYQGALNLLTVPDRPSALFVINNMMAAGTLRAVHDLGLRLPDDLSLICFDQLPLHGVLSPRPTFIARPMHEQGAMAMRLMLTRVRSPDSAPAPRRLVMPVELVVGGSTAARATAPA
jgi:LacI family transcriptional regulator